MSLGASFGSLRHPLASLWAAMIVFGMHLRLVDPSFGELWLSAFAPMCVLGGSLKFEKVNDPSESDGPNTHLSTFSPPPSQTSEETAVLPGWPL